MSLQDVFDERDARVNWRPFSRKRLLGQCPKGTSFYLYETNNPNPRQGYVIENDKRGSVEVSFRVITIPEQLQKHVGTKIEIDGRTGLLVDTTTLAVIEEPVCNHTHNRRDILPRTSTFLRNREVYVLK